MRPDRKIRKDHKLMIRVCEIQAEIEKLCTDLGKALNCDIVWEEAQLLKSGVTLNDIIKAGESDDIQGMEKYISDTLGGLGIDEVEFADEDGNVSHTIPCKPKLRFVDESDK